MKIKIFKFFRRNSKLVLIISTCLLIIGGIREYGNNTKLVLNDFEIEIDEKIMYKDSKSQIYEPNLKDVFPFRDNVQGEKKDIETNIRKEKILIYPDQNDLEINSYTSLYREMYKPKISHQRGLFANLSLQVGHTFFDQLKKSRKSYISGSLPESLRQKSDFITILLYHPFYKNGPRDWNFGLGTKGFQKAGCRINKCNLVSNKKHLETAEAVVFFTPSFYPHVSIKNRFPDHERPAYQKWIVHLMESNVHGWLNTAAYSNYYNATMTYRRNSDIYTPYGHYERIQDNENYDSTANYALGKFIYRKEIRLLMKLVI